MTTTEAQAGADLAQLVERAERAIRAAPMTARQAEDVVSAFRQCLELTCPTGARKRAWCERVTREYEGRQVSREGRQVSREGRA